MGIPPIPRVEGPLEIRVIHPTPDMPRPRVDSTFVYGSVGTGEASLRINGVSVEVAPNGAFLAFLPVPRDGRYELVAEARGRTERATAAYRAPSPAPARSAPAPTTTTFPRPLFGLVTGGADTLATGSDVAIGRTTPGGSVYRWFFPRGARLVVTGRRGDQLRVWLDSATVAWLPASAVTLGEALGPPRPAAVGLVTVESAPEWVDVRVPADGAPFRVQQEGQTLSLTLYGARAPAVATVAVRDALLAGGRWSAPHAGVARLDLRLAHAHAPWGYKAFYNAGGELVLRLRRAPRIDPAQPLRGIRIVVDPGHPPAGATGPTGLREADANLPVALRLAERLRAAGADVILTRSRNVDLSLKDRVDLAVARDAHLLVSVHNNAFAEGANPFRNHGTSTYYFHPHSAGLARSLNREIVAFTRIRDLGAITGNLALVRPTWMPTTLTESLFLPIPEQEAALRDPGFADRLAAAHVRGIENFLLSVVDRQLLGTSIYPNQ